MSAVDRPLPLWPLALSLFLSGAAALAYQVLWVRQLTLLLGTTLPAVATVLGLFMAGLGIGAILAGRWMDRLATRRLPQCYAGLELGIGAFAIVFPLLLSALAPLYRMAGDVFLLRLLATGLLLLVPATLMGATLPALTALRERSPSGPGAGRSAGLLYAANTAGAVAGSLAVALVLLPSAGTRASTLIAAALNGMAAAIVLLGTRRTLAVEGGSSPQPVSRPSRSGARIALAVAGLSGFAALVSEVAWTRSLVLLIGPTTYGFSFIVSSAIFGIALGSAAGSAWSRRPSAAFLGWAQLGAATSSLLLALAIGKLVLPAGELVRALGNDAPALLGGQLLAIAALLLAPSFFFGATFPLAVAVVDAELRSPGAATGRTLAFNTAGALLGSLSAGLVLVPRLGAENALRIGVAAHLLAAALAAIAIRRRLLLVPAVALSGAGVLFLPHWDRELLSGGLYRYARTLEPGEFLDFLRQGELLYFREDRVATVSVKRVANRLSLAVDGKVDATNAEDMLTQRLLAHVPLLLQVRPREVLVIGHGSGVTAGSALAHPIENLEAVEISEAVAEASALFRDFNRDPAADPRFRLVLADARNYLLRSNRKWDVIISEPSNPWMAGVSSLFTREFFELARSRLAPSGLFCQWAHLYGLTEEDLKTIVGGFTDVFDSTALFLLSESDLLLVGARDGLSAVRPEELDLRMSPEAVPEAVKEDLEAAGIRGARAMASLFTSSTPALSEWSRLADRHTDDRPILEFRAARAFHGETRRENRRALASIGTGEEWFVGFEEPGPLDLLARARALEGAESFEWAFETYSKAIEADPRLYDAYEGLVRAALASGQAELCEEKLRNLTRGSESPEPLLGLGLLFRRVGRLEEAVLALGGALGLDPKRRAALVLSAEVASDRGETGAMASFARHALALDPLDAEAAALVAEAALREGNLEDAARMASSILAHRSDEPRALQVHAVANAELGHRNVARSSFEKLVELEPEDWIQLNNLGRLELESSHPGRAADLFERAVDLNPRNLIGYRGLEQAALATGDRERLERARAMLRFLGARQPLDRQSKALDSGSGAVDESVPSGTRGARKAF